mmetsp:Transcript_18483/g.39704  ORF Transcript_18483/g.39704 Transcript_18483/m.39704 type:complete len:458 (+) Transcript_18483:258-1631(+)
MVQSFNTTQSSAWVSYSSPTSTFNGINFLLIAAALLSILVNGAAGEVGIDAVAAATEQAGNRWDLMDCINQNSGRRKLTTWSSAMSTQPAPLTVLGIWWSSKPAEVPLTITMQMSAARLWQLNAMCMQYPGPVSAVLYVGVLKSKLVQDPGLLSSIIDQTGQFFKAMEKHGRCKLDLMLIREVFADREAKIWYPINQLRNYARLQARTPLIGIVDGDLLVSPIIVDELKNRSAPHYAKQLLSPNSKLVYVLPAFQAPSALPKREAMQLAEESVSMSKAQMWHLYNAGLLVPFDPGKPGHNATNYTRWFGTDESYAINYEFRYEPWIVCSRTSVPWHDIIFRGYGLNKIVHLEHLNTSGYRFMVHPKAFLVHRAHRSTTAKKLVLSAKQMQMAAMNSTVNATSSKAGNVPLQSTTRTLYGYTQKLGQWVRSRMAEGSYTPTVDPALENCLRMLSWWQQ